jgi:hypothetical protein
MRWRCYSYLLLLLLPWPMVLLTLLLLLRFMVLPMPQATIHLRSGTALPPRCVAASNVHDVSAVHDVHGLCMDWRSLSSAPSLMKHNFVKVPEAL